jgi:thiol-disulfide isomerase/thioredoxin
MKPVLMFVTSWCSFCKLAFKILASLREETDAFRTVEITVIDEELQREYAASFDYYLVPTFYVGGKKLHEGIPTKNKLRRVLEEALSP